MAKKLFIDSTKAKVTQVEITQRLRVTDSQAKSIKTPVILKTPTVASED